MCQSQAIQGMRVVSNVVRRMHTKQYFSRLTTILLVELQRGAWYSDSLVPRIPSRGKDHTSLSSLFRAPSLPPYLSLSSSLSFLSRHHFCFYPSPPSLVSHSHFVLPTFPGCMRSHLCDGDQSLTSVGLTLSVAKVCLPLGPKYVTGAKYVSQVCCASN